MSRSLPSPPPMASRPAAADDRIGAVVATEEVDARAAEDDVVISAARDQVIAVAGVDDQRNGDLVRRVDDVIPAARQDRDLRGGGDVVILPEIAVELDGDVVRAIGGNAHGQVDDVGPIVHQIEHDLAEAVGLRGHVDLAGRALLVDGGGETRIGRGIHVVVVEDFVGLILPGFVGRAAVVAGDGGEVLVELAVVLVARAGHDDLAVGRQAHVTHVLIAAHVGGDATRGAEAGVLHQPGV